VLHEGEYPKSKPAEYLSVYMYMFISRLNQVNAYTIQCQVAHVHTLRSEAK
jgi:hypothetical protein